MIIRSARRRAFSACHESNRMSNVECALETTLTSSMGVRRPSRHRDPPSPTDEQCMSHVRRLTAHTLDTRASQDLRSGHSGPSRARSSVCVRAHSHRLVDVSLALADFQTVSHPTTVPQGAATQPHARKAFTSPPRLSTSCRCQSWPLQSDPKRRPPWWICPPRLHSS